MKTLAVDKYQRVRLPAVRGGDRLAYTKNGDGSITLTPIKPVAEEPFPEGSLAYLCTPEHDAEMSAIAKACIIGMPDKYDPE